MIMKQAGQVSARESAYKAALQERDAKIAELESANAMLKAPTTGTLSQQAAIYKTGIV